MSARPPSTEDLRARVLAAVQREPVAARPEESRHRALLVALGFAAAGVVALTRYALERAQASRALATTRPSAWHVVSAGSAASPHHSLAYLFTLEAAWVLILIGATWTGVARGRSMLGRSASTLLAVAVLTPMALALTWFAVAHAELGAFDDAPGADLHLHCVLMSVAYSLGPMVAFLAVRRGTDPINSRWAGAAIGAAAGAWGAVLYIVSCDCSSPIHIALAHVLPVALFAAAGALVGERVLGPAGLSAR